MYKTTNEGVPTPTANIAINNSRVKLYGKTSEVPTYYLQKGQEFQIELHNPTKDTICAKISLNGNPISQGGLVLKPAQRVFLDRYIDVARKFKFDTYEVTNTSENRQAIEDNGDLSVEFYREQQPSPYFGGSITIDDNVTTLLANTLLTNTNNTTLGLANINDNQTVNYNSSGVVTMDSLSFMDQNQNIHNTPKPTKRKRRFKSKKSIETGRVEQGERSDQSMNTVYMNLEYTPFHSVEYKIIPVSQKVNTVQDTQLKRYCTSCGSKQKPKFKFCPSCGTRV